MALRRVGPEGCRYDHGPDRMTTTPDGLWYCRTCHNYSEVLQRARKILPGVVAPTLHEHVAEHGFESIDRMRLAMRKLPSRARRHDGRYQYAQPDGFRPVDDRLGARGAVPIWEADR